MALLVCAAPSVWAQTNPQPLQVTRIYGVTSSSVCIDNRSINRQNNYHSFVATGPGSWSVQMQFSQTSCAGPWTSYGSTALVTNSSGLPIGFGFDGVTFHNYVSFAITGSATVNYSASRDYYLSTVVGSISFPISVSQGGTGLTSVALNGILLGNGSSAMNVASAGSAYQIFAVPSGGGAPVFGAINLAQAAAVGATILGIANGGTNGATATAGFNNLSPMTALGDLIYGGSSGSGTRLAGDTSNTRKFLRTLSTGGVAQAPVWDTLQSGDVPACPICATGGPFTLNQLIFGGGSQALAVGDLTGDTTTSGGKTTTTGKVNGVAYPSAPSTNTVPVVTGANTITYEAVPNAALANSSVTINSTFGISGGGSLALGGSLTLSRAEAVVAQTATSYTFQATDCGKLITESNVAAIANSLPQAGGGGNFAAGCEIDVQNTGAGTVTITPVTSTIDGVSSLALTTAQGVRLVSDGINYFTIRGIGGGSGGGSVTQVTSGNFSPLFTVSVANQTTTPAFSFTSVNQNANLVYAGPASGAASAPTFRALVPLDLSSAVNAQTGTTYTFTASDNGKLVTQTNVSPITDTLPQAGSAGFQSGYFVDVENRGSGLLSIVPTTSTIDGGSSVTLITGQGMRIVSDGVNYFTQRGASGIYQLTGDVTAGPGSGPQAATIAAGAVSLAKMANLAANSVIGNNTGSPATPVALTQLQLTAMINPFTSSLSGAASASGGGTANFLRADNAWAIPNGNYAISSNFNFPAQTPGGSLSSGVAATATLTPCPQGLAGTDVGHFIYISGGTGTPEAVAITGGTCTSGAGTGSVTFTPNNNHTGAWTISSATSGITEAFNTSHAVWVPTGTWPIYGPIRVPSFASMTCSGKFDAVLQAQGATVGIFDAPGTKNGVEHCGFTATVQQTAGGYGIRLGNGGGNENSFTRIDDNYFEFLYNAVQSVNASQTVFTRNACYNFSHDCFLGADATNPDFDGLQSSDNTFFNNTLSSAANAAIEILSTSSIHSTGDNIIGGGVNQLNYCILINSTASGGWLNVTGTKCEKALIEGISGTGTWAHLNISGSTIGNTTPASNWNGIHLNFNTGSPALIMTSIVGNTIQCGSTGNNGIFMQGSYQTVGIGPNIVDSCNFGYNINSTPSGQVTVIGDGVTNSGTCPIFAVSTNVIVVGGITTFGCLTSNTLGTGLAGNGSSQYASDANSTCNAGSSSGRNCYKEGGSWTH